MTFAQESFLAEEWRLRLAESAKKGKEEYKKEILACFTAYGVKPDENGTYNPVGMMLNLPPAIAKMILG